MWFFLERRKGSDIQKQEKDIEEHQSLNESALENTISKGCFFSNFL